MAAAQIDPHGARDTLHVDAVVTDTAMLSTGAASDTRTFANDLAVTVTAVNDAPDFSGDDLASSYAADDAACGSVSPCGRTKR